MSPPGQVCTPMLTRSSALNRSITQFVQLDELLEHRPAGPRVARVVLTSEAPFGEGRSRPDRTGRERLPDVLLGRVAQVGKELLPRAAIDLIIKQVEQREHGGRDDRLLDRLAGQRH